MTLNSSPRRASFLGMDSVGFHAVNYLEWGERDNDRVILCVHGLTRNARDFDFLAVEMSQHARVVAVDVAGRGDSEWLVDPRDYAYPQYLSDMTALIARLGVPCVDWVGTSMGGLIGMLMAARPNSPVTRLILNDVGPFIPREALMRIAEYVGLENRFSSLDGLERHLRKTYAPFGPLTDRQWLHLVIYGHRRLPDGSFALNFDPKIADNVTRRVEDIDMWAIWDRIRCPTLVLRGAESDLLRSDTLDEMTRRGPHAQAVEFPSIGHAPALMDSHQIDTIRNWLGFDP